MEKTFKNVIAVSVNALWEIIWMLHSFARFGEDCPFFSLPTCLGPSLAHLPSQMVTCPGHVFVSSLCLPIYIAACVRGHMRELVVILNGISSEFLKFSLQPSFLIIIIYLTS